MLLIWYNRIIGLVLFLLGLAGFFIVKIPNFVQLDLFQSFVYLIFGAIGLQLGWAQAQNKTRSRYATATGLLGLIFLGFGLTLPNFGDIFHLELPEHVGHAILGLTGCIVGDLGKKR
ncbi:MAG: hypothetical protein HY974_02890 [Candidatus Kerfeldbacteria bacterium]|nr:hypothetical protein [Candidatus Kerfeldbacteria bacterium]